MERILDELNRVPGIKGSLIIGTDGIIIASELSDEVDEEEISALTSSLIFNAEKICNKLDQGSIKDLLVETSKSKWCIRAVKVGYLVALTRGDANLGLLRVELRDAAVKINNLNLEV